MDSIYEPISTVEYHSLTSFNQVTAFIEETTNNPGKQESKAQLLEIYLIALNIKPGMFCFFL
jgi:hypothetical protein